MKNNCTRYSHQQIVLIWITAYKQTNPWIKTKNQYNLVIFTSKISDCVAKIGENLKKLLKISRSIL